MTAVYIIIAILVFGFMILVHELGHFLFAKKFGVAINEFSIGMGPKIFSKKGKDGVDYSLRLFPIGGFVAMEGEGEESDNPNAFNKKPAWQRFIIIAAGAVMNLLIGFIIMTALTISNSQYGTTTIGDFRENSVSYTCGLRENDKIIKVEGASVHTANELSYEIMRSGYKPIKITVIRGGEKITLDNVSFPKIQSQGVTFGTMDFRVYGEKKTFSTIAKNSFYSCKSTVKMIWDSLYDLITGRYGVEQVSGPIGVTGAISDAAKTSAYSLFYIIVVISVNLGIFNLLPIPALDGGSLFFLLIEIIFKKPVPQKVESMIRAIGFGLLMLLVIFVSFKDVIYLFKR